MMIIILIHFQKFFGIIRQVSGPNDHPTTPTFLQLYRMLSVYAVIKQEIAQYLKVKNYILIIF